MHLIPIPSPKGEGRYMLHQKSIRLPETLRFLWFMQGRWRNYFDRFFAAAHMQKFDLSTYYAQR